MSSVDRGSRDGTEPLRTRAIDLFTYLLELTALRTKVVRDYEQYESVFWFADVPEYGRWRNIAKDTPVDDSASVWLEVAKIREPRCPEVPDECEPWVDPAAIRDDSFEPGLLAEIEVLPEGSGAAEPYSVPRRLLLRDHPEVLALWDDYLRKQWRPWAEKHKRWKVLHVCYEGLFSLYRQYQKLQEEYELVLSLGLLHWVAPSKQRIRRHLLVGKAEVSFDAESGKIRVGPSADGVGLALEHDMFEADERPPLNVQKEVEGAVADCAEIPWDREAVGAILRSWVHAIDTRGEYEPGIERPRGVSEQARIAFAPAIVLRRRTRRSLATCFADIVEQLKAGEDVPFGIRRVCEMVDDGPAPPDEAGGDRSRRTMPAETYFPLPSNEEQRQIVERLRDHQGVLVQGPPGTGKSHTIANLICHLLASGQRILVTSQTPRALQVLAKLLGRLPELAPLCVSVLGNDRASLDNLKDAVERIKEEHYKWDERENERDVKKLESLIVRYRSEIADLNRRQLELREVETYKHSILNGAYSGTAQAIAERIAAEEAALGWIPDQLGESSEIPFGAAGFRELRQAYLRLPAERCRELTLTTLDHASVPDAAKFDSLVAKERTARESLERCGDILSNPDFTAASGVDSTLVDGAARCLRNYVAAIEKARHRPGPWTARAIENVVSEKERPWEELRDLTARHLGQLRELMHSEGTSVSIPEGMDRDSLRADAEDLLSHLENGGGFGWWIFAAPVVKRTRYLRTAVRVSGRVCDNQKALSELLAYIRAQDCLEAASRAWAGIEEFDTGGLLSLKIAELEERLEALDLILALREPLASAQNAVTEMSIRPPDWRDNASIGGSLKVLEAVSASHVYRDAKAVLDDYASEARALAASPRAHPSVGMAAGALEERDLNRWGGILDVISQLEQDAESLSRRADMEKALTAVAPRTASLLAETASDDCWDEKLGTIEAAWHWTQACRWLGAFIAEHDATNIEKDLTRAQASLSRAIAQVAAKKAWGFCFSRLTTVQRQHLIAWAKAIRRIGKGKGKYANKHRRDAQASLEQCRSAIPAWIMPFYRVAESGLKMPGLFDVVIVDEASQSGPEALLLFYIAKKVLVVGDDQQISPAAVGVNQAHVSQLEKKHLSEIPISHSLDPQGSLFQQAEIRFGGRIVLREHFRCMPEIIRFSNDLCYSATPLRCLRQYPPNRLEPIMCRHITDGHKEGGRHAINLPEATAVVDQIVECCGSDDYVGKTMGVISLLGEHQARKIEQMLIERLSPEEIEERRIVCGDAYAFQGDERDVIFLSMVAARNERFGALVNESAKQRFNVAASRARDQMWLFHSVTTSDLNPQCMRHALLSHMLDPSGKRIALEGVDYEGLRRRAETADRDKERPPEPFDSWFEVDVCLAIASRGYRVVPQYRVATYSIDLVVEGFEGRLAIECDGDEWHGPDRYEQDMARQRVLERCGWTFWRVRGSDFCRNREAALAPLWEMLAQHEILPGGEPSDKQRAKIAAARKKAESEAHGVSEDLAEDEGTTRQRPLLADVVQPPEPEPEKTGPKRRPLLVDIIQPVEPEPELPEEQEEDSEPLGLFPSQLSNVEPSASTAPYTAFEGAAGPDPRNSGPAPVAGGLCRIIQAEGPMLCKRAYDVYLRGCGIKRMGRELKRIMNKALQHAIQRNKVVVEDEHEKGGLLYSVVRLAGTPPVIVRERGPRTFEEIPPSEVQLVARRLAKRRRLEEGSEGHMRAVLDHFDLKRLTTPVSKSMEDALKRKYRYVDEADI